MQKPRNGSERFGTVSRAVVYFRKRSDGFWDDFFLCAETVRTVWNGFRLWFLFAYSGFLKNLSGSEHRLFRFWDNRMIHDRWLQLIYIYTYIYVLYISNQALSICLCDDSRILWNQKSKAAMVKSALNSSPSQILRSKSPGEWKLTRKASSTECRWLGALVQGVGSVSKV